ncbi:DUF1622 domain-containing protein [Vulcanococcus sp.]|jgi:uncharacterized membrane protein|uniref:DUF1622 domain-containing protein n=1 Tax=Vulcanococcus sp. TaxID=2856995 RepID=UPI0037D9EDF9
MSTELLEQPLLLLAEAVRLALETLSVITVLVGLVMSLAGLGRWRSRYGTATTRPAPSLQILSAVRVQFGTWLSLALEFQLGADIVATTTSPNRDTLIRLAVVALIRTFLNVFLARELEAERAKDTLRP